MKKKSERTFETPCISLHDELRKTDMPETMAET